MMLATKNSLLLLCMLALVLLCGAADASSDSSSQGNDVRGVVSGFVDSIKNVWKKVEGTAESTLSYDFNKDGQIGEFRSQEDAIDTRQVGGDPKAAGRFQMSRPRTGRKLDTEGEKAAPAPRLRK